MTTAAPAEACTDDLVWRALASPVRRGILDALREGPRTTGDLAGRVAGVGRCAVMQHLSVLVEAGLVLVHREGRVRWNSINGARLLGSVHRWVTPYQAAWADRMLEVKRRVEESGGGTPGRTRGKGRR